MSSYSDSVYSQDESEEQRLPAPGAQPQASARSFPPVGGHGYDPYAIAAQRPFSRPLPRVRGRDQNLARPQAVDHHHHHHHHHQYVPTSSASGAPRDYPSAEEYDNRASIRTEYGPGPDSRGIPSPQPGVTYDQYAAMSHPTRRVPFDEQASSPLQFEAFQHEDPYTVGNHEDQGGSFGGRSARGPFPHTALTSHPTRRVPYQEQASSPLQFEALHHEDPYPVSRHQDQSGSVGSRSARSPYTPLMSYSARRVPSHEQASSPLQHEALQDQSGSLGSRSARGPLPHIPLIPSVRLASLPKFPTPPGPVAQPFGAGGTGGIPLTLPRKHEYTVRNVSGPSSVVKVTNVQATGEPAGPALGDLAEISGLAEKVVGALENDSSLGTLGNKVKQWLGDVPSFVDRLQDLVEKSKSAEQSLKHDESYYANLEDFRIRSMSNSAFEALLDMMRKVEVVIGDNKSLGRKTRAKVIKGLGELHYSLERLTAKTEDILGEEVQKSRYVLNKIRACRQNLKVQNQ
ncbi:hypothetical protein LZ554_008548 [Drepanopeziza brunnea f. sp. 'monogermtubi']|nr:hypothetical protein LZ554_008548 [Drepanopeziza brunnea f. sp. 'monogermtubi']